MADRFYSAQYPLQRGSVIELDPTESHHLLRVMRARVGDAVRVFGAGAEFEGVLESGERGRALIRLETPVTPPPQPAFRICFLLPWLKGGRTDAVLQKLTELGASEFVIYRARRDVAHLEPSKLPKLERVLVEACKQCERADVPRVRVAGTLFEALTEYPLPPERCLVLAERNREGLRLSAALAELAAMQPGNGPESRGAVLIASGPEGGFHPDELGVLPGHARLVTLGPRILRAETAPVAAAAAVLAAGGDL